MKKLIENTAYWVGILTLGIIVGVTIKMVSAWVEPGAMPPGGNIAAPLNTGNTGQAKIGGLTLNIGGATYGLIVDKGLVGIKTTTPQVELDVNGDIRSHNLNLNNNLNVGGETNLNGNLHVGGNTDIGGSLTVNGNFNVNGSINATNTIDWSNPKEYSATGRGPSISVTTPIAYKLCTFQGGYTEVSGYHDVYRNSDGTWTGLSNMHPSSGFCGGPCYGSVKIYCYN